MNNRQAIGYMLLACEQAGFTKEQATELFEAMYQGFDLKTEEEAERDGFNWYQSEERF